MGLGLAGGRGAARVTVRSDRFTNKVNREDSSEAAFPHVNSDPQPQPWGVSSTSISVAAKGFLPAFDLLGNQKQQTQ